MSRPRLIHVTTSDISLELLLGPQLRAFQAAGYEVIGMSAPGSWVPRLEADGIAHVPLRHATRAMAPHRDLAAMRELYRAFRRLRPAIVHTHNPKTGVYGRIAARAARVPVVVNTVHGLYAQREDPFRRRAFVYSLERIAASCSMAELVQNHEDLETLARLRVPRRKLTLLGNGVDLDRFDPVRLAPARERLRRDLGIRDDEVLVGAVGRLVWEKGYRELFAAAEAIRRGCPNARFVVVGPHEPDKADAVDTEAVESARQSGVTFLGLRDDIDDLYTAMDVYVLASHREGFPRSAMEAAAMGLPVVATDIRGCRQVVDHGRTGLLVPARDAGALAGAIRSLIGEAATREAMGTAARAKAAREFDQARVITTTLATYDRLLRSSSNDSVQGASA